MPVIFFDVDYTILSSDYELRRGTVDVFEQLVEDGHEVHVWSGEGKRHKVLEDHGLIHLVAGVHTKPIFDYVRRLETLRVPAVPDFVIDDHPGIVDVFGGFFVTEFYTGTRNDDQMEHIYEVICEWTEIGSSTHSRWRPRHANFDEFLKRGHHR